MAQWLRRVTCIFLPALTLAACRIKISVTRAVSVESHSHLFVFHLVAHLCISMVSARSCTINGRLLIKFGPFHKSSRVCLYYSAMCESIPMPLTARLGPSDPLPLKPRSQTDGKRAFMKKSANYSAPWELRTVRRLDKRLKSEPEPTVILTLENPPFIKSPVGKVVSGPAPCALQEVWTASGEASLHPSCLQLNYRTQYCILDK